jgi:arylsulfatase A-like enzyme
MSRPNILIILTDEHRFDGVGFNGNPHIRTPNLDRLASEATNLAGHTCSTPVCTPSRASMMTGRYARSHGAFDVGYTLEPPSGADTPPAVSTPLSFKAPPPEPLPLLSTCLKRAGFRTGYFGKAHFHPSLDEERAPRPSAPHYDFDTHHTVEDHLEGGYIEFIRREHPEQLDNARKLANEGYQDPPIYSAGGTLGEVFTSEIPQHLYPTSWITDRTLDFLDAGSGEPFFAVCSYLDPHHPWTPPEPFASMYRPEDLPVPPRRPEDTRGLKPGYYYTQDLPDSEYRRMVAAYYSMITLIDHNVGRILDRLERNGQLENTLIVFTSDHGDYNGDHGLIRKNLWLYDVLLRVPCLIRLPGQTEARRLDGPSQHEDLMPTLLNAVGVDVPTTVQGKSWLANLVDPALPPPREFAYYEQPRRALTGPSVGVRHGDWKLLHYPESQGFVLADTRRDPMEYVNRSGEPACAAIERRLRDALLQWLLTTPHHRPPKTWVW